MFEKKIVSFLSDDSFPRGFRAHVRVSVYESYLSIYCVHISCEGRKKTGRASVLLHHILGYEETSTEEGRYWVISRVKDYDDVLMFLNVLLLVMEKLDHLAAVKTTQDYL